MRLIDTHAHLDDPAFDLDRNAVLQRAADAGVEGIITVGTNISSSRRAIAISERYPQVYATVGVHPHQASSVTPTMLVELEELASHPRVVAIGEIGLDFYRDLSPRDAQRDALSAQLDVASRVAKPVVIHIRDRPHRTEAYRETLRFLRQRKEPEREERAAAGVLHCFSGDLETVETALSLGFLLGVDGPVTYPKATELCSLLAGVPLARLLLETDCPYLSPQRWRGRRNEPAHLTDIVRRVAELKQMSAEHVASATTENAVRLFGCRRD